MRRTLFSMAIMAMMGGMMGGCSNEEVTPGENNHLKIVAVETEGFGSATRNSLENTLVEELNDGTEMSVWVMNASQRSADIIKYDNRSYSNLKLVKENGTWAFADNKIVALTAPLAKVCAIYPYTTSVKDNLLHITSDDTTDYMYAMVTNVNEDNPSVVLSMKHIRCIMAIRIKSDAYTGKGNLTAGTLSGDGLYPEFDFNIVTGESDYIDYTVQDINLETGSIADGMECVTETYLMSRSSSLKVSLTVDEKTYDVELERVKNFNKGMIYTYTLVLKGEKLAVESVSEELAWGTEEREVNISTKQ